jgi:hypothetical protein
MDVYLVPVGAERYELYCEISDEPETRGEADPPRNRFRRLLDRFKQMIAEAEHERLHGAPASPPKGWVGRLRARTLRWVAESIAEQKLLWHLRKQDAAVFHHPDDMQDAQAASIRRDHLERDLKKHRKWLAIDSVLMVVLGVGLFFIPGPNIIGYYFAFRVVGHYFSYRGATQGLSGIAWSNRPSAPLTELRSALALEPEARVSRVHAVAARLHLEHLESFFQRSAVST